MLQLDRNYSTKEIEDLKDFITVAYVIIDDIYQKVTPIHIKNRCNIYDSILSDSEIITISIVGELLAIDLVFLPRINAPELLKLRDRLQVC